MNCPKCSGEMEIVDFLGIEIDKCKDCGGIWVESTEEKFMLKTKGSEAIDDGNAMIGKEMNKIENVNCPVCGVMMTRMVDAFQSHIWYEKCVYHGVYFDAGEFKDLKQNNVSDGVKDFFAKIKGGRKI